MMQWQVIGYSRINSVKKIVLKVLGKHIKSDYTMKQTFPWKTTRTWFKDPSSIIFLLGEDKTPLMHPKMFLIIRQKGNWGDLDIMECVLS